MVIALLSEIVLSHVFDAIGSKLYDCLMAELRPHLQSIEDRLSRIEKTLEAQNAAPLKDAFFHLSLDEFSKARDRLISAASLEKYGAVARFWLSALLYREGKTEMAARQFSEAIQLNPFVVPPTLLPLARAFDLPISHTHWRRRMNGLGAELRWKYFVDLSRGPRLLQRFRPQSYFDTHIGGVIYSASFGGFHPVVEWAVGQSPFAEHNPILSAFDFMTGKPLWHRQHDQGTLHFATPRLVILRGEDKDGGYTLLNTLTGEVAGQMSAEYFEAVFAPAYGVSSDQFSRCNVRMDVDKSSLRVAVRDSQGGHYEEDRHATDPFGWGTYRLSLQNVWSQPTWNLPPESQAYLKVSIDLKSLADRLQLTAEQVKSRGYLPGEVRELELLNAEFRRLYDEEKGWIEREEEQWRRFEEKRRL